MSLQLLGSFRECRSLALPPPARFLVEGVLPHGPLEILAVRSSQFGQTQRRLEFEGPAEEDTVPGRDLKTLQGLSQRSRKIPGAVQDLDATA